MKQKQSSFTLLHVLLFGAIALLLTMGLQSCNSPTKPTLDSPYDKKSEKFIEAGELATDAVSNIRAFQAQSGGQFNSEYGTPVTAKGVCWSIDEDPVVGGSCTNDGTGFDEFTSQLSDLQSDTEYYVRAYATNDDTTTYGGQKSFTTMNGIPDIQTDEGTQITATSTTISAGLYGDGGAEITDWGVCYSDNSNIEVGNATCFSAMANNLIAGSIEEYYTILKKQNNSKRPPTGTPLKNQTDQEGPTREQILVDTPLKRGSEMLNDIGTRTSGASPPVDSHNSISERRQQIRPTPVQLQSELSNKTSPQSVENTLDEQFTVQIDNLETATIYYVRAYATNAVGTAYGDEVSFMTGDGIAVLTTSILTNITATSVQSGGEISDDGMAEITARGVVWSSSSRPTVDANLGMTTDGDGTGSFISSLAGLNSATQYYLRAYATNSVGTAYGEEKGFTTRDGIAVLTTSIPTNITGTSAQSGGEITDNGGADITARGVVWSTSQAPTIDVNQGMTTDGNGEGTFTSSLSGLDTATTYYVRAYATNSVGTVYGNQRNFTTELWSRDTNTAIVDVTNPATGLTWMDRNLGASRVAENSTDAQTYGDLYQWGRATDGHEKRNSNTTSTLSSSDQPSHGEFILAPDSPNDWRSPQNDNLWQGVNGINNPCPDGYRLPTELEWEAEWQSWSSNDAAGAFGSPLKLPMAGGRYNSSGSLYSVGSNGGYWSGSVSSTDSRRLYFDSSFAGMSSYGRANGFSVRCIKD